MLQHVSNLTHSLHVLSLRLGDKTCRKVHSLHILSLLRQQHYNLSFPFLIVCVCVCARARAHECVCVCPRAPTCVLFIVFITPASISPKLKFCIALSIL